MPRVRTGISLLKAAGISFVLSLVVGLLVLIIPFLAGEGLCVILSILGLCSTSAILMGFIEALFVFTFVGTVGGGVLFVIWSVIPLWVQWLLAAGIILIGILLVQPEADVIGILGAIFAFMGNNGKLARR